MKKNLNLILVGVGLILSLIVFVTMAGAGLTAPVDLSAIGFLSKPFSVYEMMSNDLNSKIAVTCLIMVIVGTLLNAVVLITDVLKKYSKYNKFISLLSSVVLLVGGIMFFTLATGDIGKLFNLGVGAIFSGILAIVSAVCIGVRGTLELLKK